MNNNIHNFLALLGGVVNTEAVNHQVELDALIEPLDWGEIFRLAKEHNVYALVFEKATEVPGFLECPEYNSGMVKAMSQMASQMQRTDAFLELYRAFSEEGLKPIVMKGIVCRHLYGKYGDHRPSGDEDILIKKGEYELAERVLIEQGYIPEYENITKEQLEELQEVSFINKEAGLHIELHINLMGHNNDLRRQMNECFTNVFDHYLELNIQGTTIRTMNHTDHYLYLVLHAFRHFTAGGFGIRQVLDILIYERQHEEEIDWKYIKEKLSEFDALLFASDLIHIGNKHFGFQLQALCPANCPEDLLEDLMSNGVFGNATQAQRTANQMTNAAVAGRDKSSGKGMTMLRTIFPSKDQLLNQHPELQEKPWLLPVRWVQRWGRFIKHSRNNGSSLAKESMEISQRRIELLKKYKIM